MCLVRVASTRGRYAGQIQKTQRPSSRGDGQRPQWAFGDLRLPRLDSGPGKLGRPWPCPWHWLQRASKSFVLATRLRQLRRRANHQLASEPGYAQNVRAAAHRDQQTAGAYLPSMKCARNGSIHYRDGENVKRRNLT